MVYLQLIGPWDPQIFQKLSGIMRGKPENFAIYDHKKMIERPHLKEAGRELGKSCKGKKQSQEHIEKRIKAMLETIN